MRRMKKIGSLLLVIALLLSGIVPGTYNRVEAKMQKLTYYVGQKAVLSMTGVKKKRVKWKSYNKKVVSISKRGKLKAKKAGTAKIRAKWGKNTYFLKVVVKNKKKKKKTSKKTSSSNTKSNVSNYTTPTPTPSRAPITKTDDKPQAKDISFSVKLLQSGEVLVTVKNNSKKFITGVNLTIKCYNTQGVYLDETYAQAKYLKSNGGVAYDVVEYWGFPSGTDYSKCRASISINYDGVNSDMSWCISPTIKVNGDYIDFTLTNKSGMYTAYFSPVLFYYDNQGNIIAADDGASSYSIFSITPKGTFEESFLKPRSVYTGEDMPYQKVRICYTAGTRPCS